MTREFDYLMRALVRYLEVKRQCFPRLYFLSNEQIIELVGQVEDVFVLQRGIFKIFEGISELKLLFRGSPQQRAMECMKIVKQKKQSVKSHYKEFKQTLQSEHSEHLSAK